MKGWDEIGCSVTDWGMIGQGVIVKGMTCPDMTGWGHNEDDHDDGNDIMIMCKH